MADFEKQLTALESVVERLEQGDLSLEESVRLFEEGIKLSDACKKELEAAEGKIQLLVDRGKNGMKVVDLDMKEDVTEDETQLQRSRVVTKPGTHSSARLASEPGSSAMVRRAASAYAQAVSMA